jgi:TM2 domain-containing membrane protein YozV
MPYIGGFCFSRTRSSAVFVIKASSATPAAVSRIVAVSPDDGAAIDLRNPAVAAFLGWLVPGLGHLYQGRTLKGWLFMATLVGVFFVGMWIGGGHVVYCQWRGADKRIAFLGQAGIGAAAVPALIQSWLMEGAARQPFLAATLFAPPVRMGQYVSPRYAARLIATDASITADDFFDRPPLKQFRGDQLAIWQFSLGRLFDIGTLYTMLAGMLNMLVIYDAWAGPLGVPTDEQRKAARGDVAATAPSR